MCLTTGPVLAQYVMVQCSQNIRAVGGPAVQEKKAQQSAIQSWDAEARRIHGARTKYTFRWAERMGRVQMTCSRNRGRVACSTSGRSYVYVPTNVPNTEVSASCRQNYVLQSAKSGACIYSDLGELRDRRGAVIVTPPRAFYLAECPTGYTLNGTRCTR